MSFDDRDAKTGALYQFLKASYAPKLMARLKNEANVSQLGPDEDAAFESFASHDPMANAVEKPYAYLQWLCLHHVTSLAAEPLLTDARLQKSSRDLGMFHECKAALPSSERDIYRHTPESLAELAGQLEKTRPVSNLAFKRLLTPGLKAKTRIIYDGPEGMIVVPQTKESAQFWGQDTRCRIAAEGRRNSFDSREGQPVVLYLPEDRDTGLDEFGPRFVADTAYFVDADADSWDDLPDEVVTLLDAAQKKGASDFLYSNMPFTLVPEEHRTKPVFIAAATATDDDDEVENIVGDVPDNFWDDKAFCLGMVRANASVLNHLSSSRIDADTYIAALAGRRGSTEISDLLDAVPGHLWHDEKFGIAQHR